MTTPSEEEKGEEAIEKELSQILDEVEGIIYDPSESIERKKEAQTMIQRAIEKGSSSSKTKSGEELRKRYVYITRMYYTRQIQELEVIKGTLKRQIEEEEENNDNNNNNNNKIPITHDTILNIPYGHVCPCVEEEGCNRYGSFK